MIDTNIHSQNGENMESVADKDALVSNVPIHKDGSESENNSPGLVRKKRQSLGFDSQKTALTTPMTDDKLFNGKERPVKIPPRHVLEDVTKG